MLNRVILMGRLTAVPEIRMSTSGNEVMSFTIAVDRKFADSNRQRKTDFINCVAWKGTAKFIHAHFNKGQMINVCGTLQVREWTTAEGAKRYTTEVIVDEANFCGDKPKEDPLNEIEETIGGTQITAQGLNPVENPDDDLPF